MSALDELMSNIGWMIHDLVDGNQIDNEEELRLTEVHEHAAAELAALTAENESRRVALLAKSEEARREWIRAENAEARLQAACEKLLELADAVEENSGEGESTSVSLLSVAMELRDLAAALRGAVTK